MTRVDLAARTGDSAWHNSDVAWQSPTGDTVAVFAGHGGQGMGSSVAHHVARELGTPLGSSARERAAWVVRRAHEIATTRMDPAFGTFGTMASLAWDEDGVAVAHAGDARVYRLRPLQGEIECLTRDDVAGDTEPMNRMLVNAVGGLEDVRIHECAVACMPDDVFVCCTSRVWRSLGDAQLLSIIERSREDASAAIVQRVAELEPSGGSAVASVFWASGRIA